MRARNCPTCAAFSTTSPLVRVLFRVERALLESNENVFCIYVNIYDCAVKNEMSATLRGSERPSMSAHEVVTAVDVDAAIALLDDTPPSHAPPNVERAATIADAAAAATARREMVDSFLD